MTQAYALKGRKIASKPYHYKQCGLDDVYLLNGYTRHKTEHGEGISVEHAEELHDAIAQSLCMNKPALTGKEFRFLRKLMNLTQSEAAQYFGRNVQAIARWEKSQTDLDGAADRLFRLLYLSAKKVDISAEDLLKMLVDMDTKVDDRQVFEKTAKAWKPRLVA